MATTGTVNLLWMERNVLLIITIVPRKYGDNSIVYSDNITLIVTPTNYCLHTSTIIFQNDLHYYNLNQSIPMLHQFGNNLVSYFCKLHNCQFLYVHA